MKMIITHIIIHTKSIPKDIFPSLNLKILINMANIPEKLQLSGIFLSFFLSLVDI